MEGFTKLKLSRKNLDHYVMRKSILNGLTSSLSNFSGVLLDVGCGKMPYKKYILENSNISKYVGLDIDKSLIYDESITPDYTWNGEKMPLADESFNVAMATEVLEHCPYPEKVLKETHRILKPGGVFFFTVPFLWSLHEVPHDEYRYTPFSLERHLRNSGFSDIVINATGGWHAAMAQMLGLWVLRAPISPKKRKFLSFCFKPIIMILSKLAGSERVSFKEGQMITGLHGVAYKK